MLFERLRTSTAHILLLGPRQVGKSTLIKRLNPDLIINLADEALFVQYSKDPRRLRKEIEALSRPALIAIDEIQRVPALLNSVQVLIDSPPQAHRYILTGSSARKLRRGGTNLLPGRVIVEYLDPLLASEATDLADKKPFNLDRALTVGMLPGVFLNEPIGVDLLASYAETYLREEILSEGLSRNLGAFARLLDVVAIVSGQWLNYSKLSSDIEIPKETVRRYVALLEDTLVLHRLESFKPRTKIARKTTQRDKILLFDVGVRNALLGIHHGPISPTEIGHIFEQWFTLQIIAIQHAYRKPWKISSFLDEHDNEVDIVIEGSREIVGIEVKYGTTLRRDTIHGLQALKKVVGNYKPIKKIVAYQGDRAMLLDDDCRAIPYQEVLTLVAQIS